MKRLLRVLAVGSAIAALAAVVGGAALYALVTRDLPRLGSLEDYRPNLVTRIYSADGEVVGRLYRERREIVPIERIPRFLVQAFVAAEDGTFYTHGGLDYPGILRAAWANLRAGGIRQGGSTITQQVAKTFLLTRERSYVRKLKDMVLARRIEAHLDKNEILYLYLNQIYLGSGAYGVQAAARTYFGKSVDEITLAEGALIAGVVPAPSRYSPLVHPDYARARQRFVLARMEAEGYITADQRLAALAEPLVLYHPRPDPDRQASRWFVEEVRRYLVDRFGEDEVLTGGLDVRTTLVLRDQRAAWNAVREGLRDHDRRTGYRGPLRKVPDSERAAALLEIEAHNGAPPWPSGTLVRALVTQVDDEAGIATLALGSGVETQLRLEDVAWARKPDPEVDGLAVKISHIRTALAPGDEVELEKTGESFSDDATHPVDRFALYQEPQAEGALLALDLPAGRVRALIGGYGFDRSQFDRAVQSHRQPGSAFKPIVYATALERGYTPGTIVYDTPVVYDNSESGFTWKPQNYSEKFYGPILLRDALAKSRNLATIHILRDIGIPAVAETARKLGIRSRFGRELGIGLGQSETTLADLVAAYGAFASEGRRVEPIFVVEVRDRDGRLLDADVRLRAVEATEPSDAPESTAADVATAPPVDGIPRLRTVESRAPALDPEIAYLMTNLLQGVVKNGTGWRAKALHRPVAGKTGTTNDLHDAWFIGFTPDLVAGVWVGYDVARPLGKNETGSRAASPIFVDFMRSALRGQPIHDFSVPEGIVFIRMDRKTGLVAAPGDPDYIFQPFREDHTPTRSTASPEAGAGAGATGSEPRLD
ncbi:MAG: penicillin-binding protein 1A [Myxococcota bacterium]